MSTRFGSIGTASVSIDAELRTLSRELRSARRQVETSSRQMTRSFGNLERSVLRLDNNIGRVFRNFSNLGRALGGAGLVAVVRQGANAINTATDAYARYRDQLTLSEGSAEAAATAQAKLFDLAQETATPLQSVISLYSNFSAATQNLGLSQDDLISRIRNVSLLLAESGVQAQQASSFFLQLQQSASAGIQGEELNTFRDVSPQFLRALAEAAGTTTDNLKQLSSEGRLTQQVVLDALEIIPELFDDLGIEVLRADQSVQTFTNSWQRFLAALGESSGITQATASGIGFIQSAIDGVTETINRNQDIRDFLDTLSESDRRAATTDRTGRGRQLSPFGEDLLRQAERQKQIIEEQVALENQLFAAEERRASEAQKAAQEQEALGEKQLEREAKLLERIQKQNEARGPSGRRKRCRQSAYSHRRRV